MIWLLIFGAAIIALSTPALIYGHALGWLIKIWNRPPM